MVENQEQHDDTYIRRFLNSPVYDKVTKSTLDIAFKSYKTARDLSVALFIVGMILIVVAVVFGFFCNDREFLSLIFGGLGTANLIGLFIYRPIERVQSGVAELVRSQIACLNFMASYDSLARYLATAGELPFADENRDMQKEFERAQYLMEMAYRFTETLNASSSATKP